jgi:hypothetical protein
MRYFRICFKDDDRIGIGRTVEKLPLFIPPYNGEISGWKELVLILEDGDYPDYLSSNFGGRICSERMRNIFDELATKDDHLQWLSVKVKSDSEERQYHYLHFPSPPDVLHPKLTTFVGKGMAVKPVFCAEASMPHAVFSYPKSAIALIVNEKVWKRILKERLSGLIFYKMPVVSSDE